MTTKGIHDSILGEIEAASPAELEIAKALYEADTRHYGFKPQWWQQGPITRLRYVRLVRAAHAAALKINARREAYREVRNPDSGFEP